MKVIGGLGLTYDKNYDDYREYAIRAHGDQKYDHLHYSYHLSQVERRLAEFGFIDDKYRASAWLHDVVEDTAVRIQSIHNLYGPSVSSIVWAVTGEGVDRAAKVASIIPKIQAYPDAAPVKVADRMANMLYSFSTKSRHLDKYLIEWHSFQEWMLPVIAQNKKDLIMWNYLDDWVNRVKEYKAAEVK